MILMLAAALMATPPDLTSADPAPALTVAQNHWDRLPTGPEVYALYPAAAVSKNVEGAPPWSIVG